MIKRIRTDTTLDLSQEAEKMFYQWGVINTEKMRAEGWQATKVLNTLAANTLVITVTFQKNMQRKCSFTRITKKTITT